MSSETYTVIERIGRGGFGVVEKVRDKNGEFFARKTFAPQVLDPKVQNNFRKRFKREVIIQQELGGAEILPVIDHDLNCQDPWFIMPLADKVYSAQIKDDKFEGNLNVAPITDILNAMQFLHKLGYVHRDLNPNNILLHEGKWKLSDLGSILPPSGGTVTLTQDTIILTEKYCAPEQRMDFHNAQEEADIYSFGCILHDIFNGKERTPYATHTATGGIGIVIEKCTHQNPKRRPSLRKLKSLVLDTILDDGDTCKIENEKSSEWLARLSRVEEWDEKSFDEFARFFAELDYEERTSGMSVKWVDSQSTPFLTRMPLEAMVYISKRKDGTATAIIEKYCEWAGETPFDFDFADSICMRLASVFDEGSNSMKAYAFAVMVRLGNTHNRLYVMRSMVNRCKKDVCKPSLEKRLAIEIKTEDIEWDFKRCILEIGLDPSKLAKDLAKDLAKLFDNY